MIDVVAAPMISIMLPRRVTQDEEIAAAIAAAVVTARQRAPGWDGLGNALETGPGAWWTFGRAQQLSTRGWQIQRSDGR
jgi:hypothetical protein